MERLGSDFSEPTLGLKIRVLRLARGLLTRDFANAANMPLGSVVSIEHGRYSPSKIVVQNLLRCLEISPEEFAALSGEQLERMHRKSGGRLRGYKLRPTVKPQSSAQTRRLKSVADESIYNWLPIIEIDLNRLPSFENTSLDDLDSAEIMQDYAFDEVSARLNRGWERYSPRHVTFSQKGMFADDLKYATPLGKTETIALATQRLLLDNQVDPVSQLQRKQIVDSMARGNLRLVLWFVANNWQTNQVTSIGDLISASFLGLLRAFEKYDPAKSSPSSYAVHWMQQATSRLQRSRYTISVPENVQTLMNKAWTAKSDPDPNRKVLSASDNERVRFAERAASAISLERLSTRYGNGVVENARDEAQSPEEAAVVKEDVGALKAALGILTDKEWQVICYRFELLADPNHPEQWTLDEIGKLLGITREGVRQLEKRALAKLAVYPPLRDQYKS